MRWDQQDTPPLSKSGVVQLKSENFYVRCIAHVFKLVVKVRILQACKTRKKIRTTINLEKYQKNAKMKIKEKNSTEMTKRKQTFE